ncbi:MAG TPA: hypothetical protein VEB70_10285 [Noviherbaspirillum sp.]|nr:hypothetical protein [Noviherbaspirillum sp.]
MRFLYSGTPVSDAALTSEFEFWKNHFLRSALLATGAGIVMGLLILLWPAGLGNQEVGSFVRQLWPAFVECGFWLGFLVGLLWAASQRIGCALAGTVPWAPADKNRARTFARVFGQAGCAAAFGSGLLWVAVYFVHQLGSAGQGLLVTLVQLVHTGWASSGGFLLLAVVLGLAARMHE